MTSPEVKFLLVTDSLTEQAQGKHNKAHNVHGGDIIVAKRGDLYEGMLFIKINIYLGCRTREKGALTNMTGRLTVNTHTAWYVQKARNLRGLDLLSSNLSSSPILMIL